MRCAGAGAWRRRFAIVIAAVLVATSQSEAQNPSLEVSDPWPVGGIVRPGEFIVRLSDDRLTAESGVTIASLLSENTAAPTPGLGAADSSSPSTLATTSSTASAMVGVSISPLAHDMVSLKFSLAETRAAVPSEALATSSSADPPMTVETVQELMADQLGVPSEAITVVPNYVGYLALEPNDPRLAPQWHHGTIGSRDAWGRRHSASGVIVAVLDSGIMLDHEDLAGNLWSNPRARPAVETSPCTKSAWGGHGYDFLNCDDDPSAEFLPWQKFDRARASCVEIGGGLRKWESHGTRVAGLIGAVGDNGRGVAGMAWQVKIMAVKVGDGVCGTVDLAAILSGIDFAIDNGADIINASWAGFPENDLLEKAIRRAGDAGVLFIAAAGNQGNDLDAQPDYPASFALDNIITVGSIGKTERVSDFSNVGAFQVDIVAPGEGIFSTTPRLYAKTARSSYNAGDGTSFSAPLVAGVAALLMQSYPKDMRRSALAKIRGWILSSARDIHADDDARLAGGILDAAKAVPTTQSALARSGVLSARLEGYLSDLIERDPDAWRGLGLDAAHEKILRSLIDRGMDLDAEELQQIAADIADQLAQEDGAREMGALGRADAIVVLKEGFSFDQYQSLLVKQGVDLDRLVSDADNAYAVTIQEGLNKGTTMKSLALEPYVLDVTPNYQGTLE
jgi:subtilisin family serine protease